MTNEKILFIISSLKKGGGAEQICSAIGTEFQKKGYNSIFFTFYNYPKEKLYNFQGQYFSLYEKISNNFVFNFLKLFKRAYQIKKYCKTNKIKTSISIMEEANFSNILSKILFLNKSKIIIYIVHSINTYNYLYKILIYLLYRYSNKIIVSTKFEKNNLIKKYSINKIKIEIIPNFLNLEKNNILKNEKINNNYKYIFNENNFIIISIGRLNKVKNFGFLIEEFYKFNKISSNSKLIILGEGEERKKLEKLIKNLNLDKKVFLLGLQNNIYPFLKEANLFISTSLNEAFSNVIIEAMSLGLPIISYNHQGGKEILKNNEYGVLYKNNLSKNIENIFLNHNLRKYLEKKSLERSKDFDLKNIILKWKKII